MPWTDTQIDVLVPDLPPGKYPVIVHTDGGDSEPVWLHIKRQPGPSVGSS